MAEFINNWEFSYLDNKTVKEESFNPCNSEQVKERLKSIYATVPGNFELDLMREKLLPNLYYGTDTLLAQKLENLHLYYYTKFDYDNSGKTDDFLIFEGIDTVAEIFLDGKKIGFTENMFHAHEFSLKGIESGKHDLLVHIIPTVIYAREFTLPAMCFGMKYNSDSLEIRKAPYMFGWDIMPRIVSGGIWKPVKIEKRNRSRIEEAFTATKMFFNEQAVLKTSFKVVSDEEHINELYVNVKFSFDGQVVEETKQRCFSANQRITTFLKNPKLWFPKNYGEQNLYKVTIQLLKNEEVLNETSYSIGIRTVKLIRTSCAGDDGEFCFEINGQKVFCLGTNWVPTDAFPSRHKDYDSRGLELLKDSGCNMVRCWGGNVYPSQEFYEFCDKNGIMVWQDFSFGCGSYPIDERLSSLIKEEVKQIIIAFRNHPSLVVWAGDNECDMFIKSSCWANPNDNIITRHIIANQLYLHDSTRPYLPSSPYIDNEAFKHGSPAEDHLWGPRDYFKGDFYKNPVCHFASEIGYHGCNSIESLKKFIPENSLTQMGDSTNGCKNADWIVHATGMETTTKEEGNPYAYRIALMISQVERLFTEKENDLAKFAMQSQISQAEAKKYFIEHFRIHKWRKTGIIWWNLIDGWPQISDAVVDWYGCKKLAYYYIKRSQQPFAMMIDEPIDGKMSLYAVNDCQQTISGKYRVTNLVNGEVVAKGEMTISANTSIAIDTVKENNHAFYLIEWETKVGKGVNHHVCSLDEKWNFADYIENMKKADFFNDFQGFSTK